MSNNTEKYNFQKDVPTIWCPGCGLFMIKKAMMDSFNELGWTNKNTVVVSGIGCTGRGAGYFNVDSLHTTHGRAIPVAEGIKLANPKLNVIVFSGDGDLFGIGGNHLLHASRRNIDITVVCNSNLIYGLTGGQMSPETPKGLKTLTTPDGAPYNPIRVQKIMMANKQHFYARTLASDINHIKDSIKKAVAWPGFAYVKVESFCITNFGRKLGYKNAAEMVVARKKEFTYQEKENVLKRTELGIVHS